MLANHDITPIKKKAPMVKQPNEHAPRFNLTTTMNSESEMNGTMLIQHA